MVKFCNLPEIGSGGKYKITVKTFLKMSEETVHSVPVSDVFTTNPFPPGNFVVEDEDLPDQPPIFAWEKSQSKTVEHYKLELKGIGIDFEKEYICLPNANDDAANSYVVVHISEIVGGNKIDFFAQD